MRLSTRLAVMSVGVSSIAMASGPGPAGKAGPPIVPYLCSDGHTAEVIYRGGGDPRRARALVSHDGRTYDMRAAPALSGIRYRTGDSQAPAVAWSLRGEQAVLSEAPDGDARSERELLRCVRVRGAPAGKGQAPRVHH